MNLAVRSELLTSFSGEVYRGMDGHIGAVWFTPKINVVVNVQLTGRNEAPACIRHLDNKADYLSARTTFMQEVAPFIERVYPNLQIFDHREIKSAKSKHQWTYTLQHRENMIISIVNIYPQSEKPFL